MSQSCSSWLLAGPPLDNWSGIVLGWRAAVLRWRGAVLGRRAGVLRWRGAVLGRRAGVLRWRGVVLGRRAVQGRLELGSIRLQRLQARWLLRERRDQILPLSSDFCLGRCFGHKTPFWLRREDCPPTTLCSTRGTAKRKRVSEGSSPRAPREPEGQGCPPFRQLLLRWLLRSVIS